MYISQLSHCLICKTDAFNEVEVSDFQIAIRTSVITNSHPQHLLQFEIYLIDESTLVTTFSQRSFNSQH